MEKEEVELLPSGLVTCFLDDREVRILKISPERLTVRVAEEICNMDCIRVMFYIFDENRYREVIIKNYKIIAKTQGNFSFTYVFSIEAQEYSDNVRNIFKKYSNYIMAKAFGDENEFSKEMVGYPAELDYEFYKYYSEQKKDWMSGLNYSGWNEDIIDSIELAITLDNDILYEQYMQKNIAEFKSDYLKQNFAENHKLFQKDITRLYIGNEFCHNLFPKIDLLMSMLQKAKEEQLQVTLCFTYMRDNYIEKTKSVIEKVYNWCRENDRIIEIVINDFGMIRLVEDKTDYFRLSLGVLLNKRKKDPRYIYKNGFAQELIGKNNLNISIYSKFLKEYKIERYEYESCGYRTSIADGYHSLHMPFYQTNTSQYCPLYAMCTTMDRGNQKLITHCPKYCKDYVFAYPKHLKMVGRYNSLFAFDDTMLKNPKELEYYINSGIDRVVLNFV
ncbi:hypothetical protein [Inconstantimicrobium mannanitabidum]|uniref:Uncharacterized protein n=1 Tax=Inconstantimicrobium mannanitabidum TaxID=1604901 RepID=A0ACB5RE60_9CLOT|nr:hypothetical protein [Clostridium sp. TW13]GKX67568.1 hypothetical protein rsdtw13_28260 [Clostridium sp. TW13]